MTTKVPAIPPVSGGDVNYILSNIKMLLDVREGRSGDSLDANVTYRDLVGLGLAQDPSGQVVYTGRTAVTTGLPVRPFGVDADGYDPTADLTPPPAPVNVAASGSIGVIYLSWDLPQYRNHSYAEIWRSGINDIGTATFIGTAASQGFVDVPGDSIVRYYWVRFVSRADVRGPYSQESVSGIASVDPAVVIRAVEGQINESSLSQSLATRINRLDQNVDVVGSIQNALAVERRVREDNDGNLYAQYTVKIDQNGHVSGFGLASETVNGTTTSAFIIRADKFAVVDPSSSSNNLTNSPSADAVPFAVVGETVYLKSAMIQDASISSAKIASLVANKITAGFINAVVGINGGKVYGGEFFAGGSVTVQTDGSGNVTGFTPSDPTVKIQSGDVTVVASSLKVSNSATGTPTDYTPFEVVNGVVYIKSAMIQNATITLAQIDTANITSLSSIKANMGTITAGKMQSTDNKFVIDLDNKTISIET